MCSNNIPRVRIVASLLSPCSHTLVPTLLFSRPSREKKKPFSHSAVETEWPGVREWDLEVWPRNEAGWPGSVA